MLFISLPTGQLNGDCRINGESAQYRIENGTLSFRSGDVGIWDVRTILRVSNGGDGFTEYMCSSEEGSTEDPEREFFDLRTIQLVPPVRPGTILQVPSVTTKRLPVYRELVAEAVHQAVCDFTGTDGSRLCMSHAIAGSWLLSRITGRIHFPQVGSLRFLAEPPDGWIEINIQQWGSSINSLEMGEFHAWIATSGADNSPQNAMVIDLTTRYWKKLTEETVDGEAITWSRPDPPLYLWTDVSEISDWVCLRADETATKAVWESFAESNGEWGSLCRFSYVKYVQLLERQRENARRFARRFTKKKNKKRRRKTR